MTKILDSLKLTVLAGVVLTVVVILVTHLIAGA
jgi:hypothetical protein